jgi:hypothetical protein
MAKRSRGRGGRKPTQPREKTPVSNVEIPSDDQQEMNLEADCDSVEDLEMNYVAIEEKDSILDPEDVNLLQSSVQEKPIRVGEKVTQAPLTRMEEDAPDKHSGKGIQDWRQFFHSKKSFGSLQYHEPNRKDGRVIVQPPKEAIEEGILKWSSSLIGQFLEKPLPFYVVKRTVENIWSAYGKVEVFLLENGLYLFRFADKGSREAVLEEKLWHIANKPLILRRWTPGMQLLKLSLSSIPIWIKLHNLPMEFWNTTCLSHISSGVGKPLCVDSVTEEQLRLGFARVLVEVDVESTFPKEV